MGQRTPHRVHLIGVGGIHMSGIARILRARGHSVSGSDLRPSDLTDRLKDIGVTIYEGHDRANIGNAELVVYTSAAHDDNPELAEARKRGIPTIKRAQMVARLMEGKQVIAVAGCHGKTTTSALIAYALVRAGVDPTYMIGGEMIDLRTNAMPGEGPHFVVEADEFDAAFLNYKPDIALLTNVEPDHLDFYGSFDRLKATFRQFLEQVKSGGVIVACFDSQPVREILQQSTLPEVQSYGVFHKEVAWTAENIRQKGLGASSFMVKFRQQVWGEIEMRLPGIHNVSNALGAVAVAEHLGLPKEKVRAAISEFRGARRRFETVGEVDGVTIMDDYAHHPTEVRATLEAARDRFPGRRLVCLFQPHTYSRTAYLLDGFRACFDECDLLFITDTYAAREEPSAGMDAGQLAGEVRHPRVIYAGNLADSARMVAEALLPGDVLFTIGAGDVEKAGPMVLEALRKR